MAETAPRSDIADPAAPLSVFICYASADNEDQDPKRRWLDRFEACLAPYVQQQVLTIYADRGIAVGEEWDERIKGQLAAARAVVLLVSKNFLASDYIVNTEMPIVLTRRDDDGLKVFAIIISPCDFDNRIFKYPDPKDGPKSLSDY